MSERTIQNARMPSEMETMTAPHRTMTTYCPKHERLETVDEVREVKPFMVYEGAVKTERSGCEVHATTYTGCKVFFIGGPRWTQ